MPPHGSTGNIRLLKNNMVYGVMSNEERARIYEIDKDLYNKNYTGINVSCQNFDIGNAGQIWKIGEPDDSGHFKIIHPSSGKLLTASPKCEVNYGKLLIEGMLSLPVFRQFILFLTISIFFHRSY